MSKVLIGLLIATWFLNSHVLLYLFPYGDSHEKYYAFIAKSNITYELMMLFAIGAAYIESKGILKAMSCFIMILVFASIIDKAVFKITDYLYSDIIFVFVALTVSWIVWKKLG